MTIKIYQVDAFAHSVFSGNPAAICPLDEWLADEILQKIAMENNLAETGYYVKRDDRYEIRWFTPAIEVDLCGHATLAAAYVLFNYENHTGDKVSFYSHRSGELNVSRNGGSLTLDFPTDQYERVEIFPGLLAPFHIKPLEAYKGKTDYMLVFENEALIVALHPDFQQLIQLTECRGIIATAPGTTCDFVSRFFAPQTGINEDPVTGSAHTTLTPYWSKRLNKISLTGMQLSERGGNLQCRYLNERVEISGEAALFMKGTIELKDY